MSSREPLSPEEKCLVGLGASVAAGCQPCTSYHVKTGRDAGVSELGIRLAVEAALAARASATQDMARYAEAEQGSIPVVEAGFRADRKRLVALISVSAAFAANCVAEVEVQAREARAQGADDAQILAALALGRRVAQAAASKVEAAAARLGFAVAESAMPCCPGPGRMPEGASFGGATRPSD
jgi:AhpD family alkylhydroperoxidase